MQKTHYFSAAHPHACASLGIILDCPDWLDLYACDQRDVAGLGTLVTQLLEALNQER
jgi:hypothetical protein